MTHIDIHTILCSRLGSPEIAKSYLSYIDNCRKTNRFIHPELYTECHHILPRKIFPEYENLKCHEWNSINLTAYQHIVAHAKLAMFESFDMRWAYSWMLSRSKINSNKCMMINLQSVALRSGDNNPRTDLTMYYFQNMNTLEIVGPITRNAFIKTRLKKRYNVPPEVVDLGQFKSVEGWVRYDDSDPDRAIKIRNNQTGDANPMADKTVYKFQRISDEFITEELTRMAFCQKYGVSKKTIGNLFSTKRLMFVQGWMIYDESNPTKITEYKNRKVNRRADKTLYTFVNVDHGFVTMPMTRVDFASFLQVCPLRIVKLFGKRPQMVQRWTLYDPSCPHEWMDKKGIQVKRKPTNDWIKSLQRDDHMHPSSS